MTIDEKYYRDQIIDVFLAAVTREELDDIRQTCDAYRRYMVKQELADKKFLEFKFQLALITEDN